MDKVIKEAEIQVGDVTGNDINIGGNDSKASTTTTTTTPAQPADKEKTDSGKPLAKPVAPAFSDLNGAKPERSDGKSGNSIPAKKDTAAANKPAETPIKEAENADDSMYVEYLRDMKDEEPFARGEDKYQFVWAKYPNGKQDIGVYSYRGDVTYAYDYFKKNILNVNRETAPAEQECEMKGGYVKPKVERDNPSLYPEGWKELDGVFMGPNAMKRMKEATDAFSSDVEDRTYAQSNKEVTKDLGVAPAANQNVDKLWNELKRNPKIGQYFKGLKTPPQKMRAALEFVMGLDMRSDDIVAKLIPALKGEADDQHDEEKGVKAPNIQNVNDSVKPKMNKGDIMEFIKSRKPKRIVKENIKIKEIKK